MSQALSLAGILEKNKIASTGAWLILLEVSIPHQPSPFVICVVNNTEDITWSSRTWTAYPFQIGSFKEDANGELPSLSISIYNSFILQQYLEETQGGEGSVVTLRVVHSEHLDEAVPYVEETFAAKSIKTDDEWITIELGADVILSKRYPYDTYKKNFCPYKYRDTRCGVDLDALISTDPSFAEEQFQSCNRTLKACRERKNSKRFGGEPGMTLGGIYIDNL